MFSCWRARLLVLLTVFVPGTAMAAELPAAELPPAAVPAAGGRHLVFQQAGCPAAVDERQPVFQRACRPAPPPVVGVDYAPCPERGGSCDEACGIRSGGDAVAWGGPLGAGLGRLLDSVSVSGWLSQGFTWNPDSPADRFNGPQTFNDRSNEYQMNQLYLTMERPVEASGCGWDMGGRVDLLYGTDYFFVETLGLETHQDGSPRWNSAAGPRGAGAGLYGLAMPQLYAEVAAPIGRGLSVKMGHFYTIVGYESVMDPDNFFYSHSYMKQYGEPFTHTGFLATYKLAPRWNLLGGMTRGWNTWEDPNDQLGFVGGLEWQCPDGQSSLGFALTTGDEDPAGTNNRTVYSLIYQRNITPYLIYVFQHDLGIEAGAATNDHFQPETAKWYGIAQYVLYTVTPTTSVGLRIEWFRDQHNARVLGIPFDALSEGGNYLELTLGANWQPHPNVLFRSEFRWDRSNVDALPLGIRGMYDDFQDKDQITCAANVVLLF